MNVQFVLEQENVGCILDVMITPNICRLKYSENNGVQKPQTSSLEMKVQNYDKYDLLPANFTQQFCLKLYN